MLGFPPLNLPRWFGRPKICQLLSRMPYGEYMHKTSWHSRQSGKCLAAIKSVSLVLQIYPARRCLGTQNPLQNYMQKGAVSIRGLRKKIASNIRVLSISIPCISRIILRLESSGYVEHLDLSISWTISVAGMASWFLFRFKHVQTEHPIHDGKQSTCFWKQGSPHSGFLPSTVSICGDMMHKAYLSLPQVFNLENTYRLSA